MTFPHDDSWFRKLLEEEERAVKLFNPISESIKQHQKILDSINFPALEHQTQILEQMHIRDYFSAIGISNDFLSMQQEIQNRLGSIGSIAKELEFLKESTRFDSILAAQENLYRLQDQFALTKYSFELPSVRIESVLAAAEATYRLFKPHDYFSDFTLSSVAEYQFFLDKQYKFVKHDNEIVACRRMQISELSGGLFETINASIDIGVALDGQEEFQNEELNAKDFSCSGIYGHVNQHLGFVYSDRYSGNVETNFNKSIPARISRLGFSITEQIYKINSICESNGQCHVFKPTSRTMRACATIPSLVSTSEIDFYFLIDQLFFLLYEGSGTANRLISIVSNSYLEPLWKVKHLRLDARHDIDHGSRKEIENKRTKIANAYVSLISKPFPIKQGDWQKAQLQIYIEIDLMLKKIIQAIAQNN